jgi:RNA recognition motif-containing protein
MRQASQQTQDSWSTCDTPTYKNTQTSYMPEANMQMYPAVNDMNSWAQVPKPKTNANKRRQDLSEFKAPANYASITTLMIRGIPCSFSQEELLTLVQNAGLGDKYDFFYMPRAGNTTSNLGYAFINFVETKHAWTCAYTFNDVRLDPVRSAKVCTVTPADIQGIPNLRKHFRRTVVSRGPNAPMFFHGKSHNKKLTNRKLKHEAHIYQ